MLFHGDSVSITVDNGEIYTGGSVINGLIHVSVHKTEVTVGSAEIALVCEERALSKSKVTEVQKAAVDTIPSTIVRGTHAFLFELEISHSVDELPTSTATLDLKEPVGVYWTLRLVINEGSAEPLTSSAIVPIYPARVLSSNVWNRQADMSDRNDSGRDADGESAAGDDDAARGSMRGMSRSPTEGFPPPPPQSSGGSSIRSGRGSGVGVGTSASSSWNSVIVPEDAAPASPRSSGPTQATSAEAASPSSTSVPQHHHDIGNAPYVQKRKKSRNHVLTVIQAPVIISTKEEPPVKTKNKILIALFGAKFKPPDKNDLGEVQIRASLSVPRWGVFQSPQKAGIRLFVKVGRCDSVVLSSVTVKLLTDVRIKGTRKAFQSSAKIFDKEVELILPSEEIDLSSELADLEIPATCESTETTYLTLDHMVRVTLVCRALNMYYMSRWLTVDCPVDVLPSIIQIPAEHSSAYMPPAPPSYHA